MRPKRKGEGRPKKPEAERLKSKCVPLLESAYDAMVEAAKPYTFGAWARGKLMEALK